MANVTGTAALDTGVLTLTFSDATVLTMTEAEGKILYASMKTALYGSVLKAATATGYDGNVTLTPPGSSATTMTANAAVELKALFDSATYKALSDASSINSLNH